MGLHTALYRVSGGRLGGAVPGTGIRILLLDHVGAKSGTKRTAPLLYVKDGDNVAIIASKGGYPKNPAWFYNLKANPDTKVQIGGKHLAVHARVAESEERDRIWAKAVKVYRDYESYAARSKGRTIPVVVLEPR
ncbi:MAG TPA: nitroreductase family deazaflavin-dependent oxidoreductase [Solirubrobacterales bacterium]|nr:nitroreductase family deazaflavin-dependent oxidoreductase [Solirubrobacterales bacterium]